MPTYYFQYPWDIDLWHYVIANIHIIFNIFQILTFGKNCPYIIFNIFQILTSGINCPLFNNWHQLSSYSFQCLSNIKFWHWFINFNIFLSQILYGFNCQYLDIFQGLVIFCISIFSYTLSLVSAANKIFFSFSFSLG